MNEKEMTIDDVFKMAEALSKKMHDFGTQKGMEKKLAKAILNATDPDSRFKADIAVRIGTAMDAYVIITLNRRNVDNTGFLGEFYSFDREMNCTSNHRCS